MVESPAPDARPSPLPGGPPIRVLDQAPDDGLPSLRGTIGGAFVCLFLAALCSVGVVVGGHFAIEGWHLEHTAIRGVVTHVSACERNEDDVECSGRFTSLDGRVVDRPVMLNTPGVSDPAEPVHARLADPGYTHVWADDATYRPSTRGGLIAMVIFSGLTALCVAPAVGLINAYRRARGSRGGPPPV